MKIVFPVLFVLILFSCNNSKSIADQLARTDEIIIDDINSLRRDIEEIIVAYELDNSERITLKKLDSLYKSFESKISKLNNRNEILELSNSWNTELNSFHPTQQKLVIEEEIPELLIREIALHELRIKTRELFKEYQKLIEPDPRFDNVRLFIEPNIQTLQLGESYSGIVYLAAGMTDPGSVFNFYANDERLPLDSLGGIINITPTKKGRFTVTATVSGKPKSVMKDFKWEQEINFEVK